jgi:hypothetical protein
MVAQVDKALTKLAGCERHAQPADLVSPGSEGGYMDSSALRYVAALERATCACWASRPAHTFGSLAINYASIVPVQAWMGHADVNTTMRYLDDKSRADDARLLSHAFRANGDAADGALARQREAPSVAVAVGVDRDLLLAKVHAQRMGAAPGAWVAPTSSRSRSRGSCRSDGRSHRPRW